MYLFSEVFVYCTHTQTGLKCRKQYVLLISLLALTLALCAVCRVKKTLVCQGLLFWITAPEMPIKSLAFQALLPWLRYHGYDSIATASPALSSSTSSSSSYPSLHLLSSKQGHTHRWMYCTYKCMPGQHICVFCAHVSKIAWGVEGCNDEEVDKRERELHPSVFLPASHTKV